MFKKLQNLTLKQAFRLLIVIHFVLGLTVIVCVIEVSKTATFQKTAGMHAKFFGAYKVYLEILKDMELPGEHLNKINRIFDAESELIDGMGLNQLFREMSKETQSVLDLVNFLERIMFNVAGFGEVFEIGSENRVLNAGMEKIIKGYREHNISHGKLVENMKLFSGKVTEEHKKYSEIVDGATRFVSLAAVSLLLASFIILAGLYWYFYRSMVLPLALVKNDIHTASGELHANSDQQLKSASQHTSAVSEISSVMQELVATSKQISGTSSAAIAVAKETKAAVESGQTSLDHAIDGIKMIQEKVEISAANMLSLGEKSQHIGVVLDVINELSQQMTVLSYNATIEAAGAGEIGERFMAVADRIIKLAERSVESAKEVKSIIDDIQTDSNKTIVSTEDGIKAVEKGILFSQEVKGDLNRITDFTEQVMASIDEINLSINQQKSGVEQAALGVEDITVLVHEAEEGAKQVAGAANQLLGMAVVLGKL